MPRIFVSIAAYKEFDLEPTVLSAITAACEPAQLKIVVCWQHSDTCRLDRIFDLPHVSVIPVPFEQSQGVCWARHMIQQFMLDADEAPKPEEDYFLQIDGHHRFVDGWDRLLIGMLSDLEAKGVSRPILTTYLPAFDPDNDPAERVTVPWYLGFDHFDTSGVLLLAPYTLPEPMGQPVATHFWSAHFSFSRASFIQDVPVDPEGYFHGEEISMAARAWTHGYDFFSPHLLVAWHEYTRRGRTSHWHDHADWAVRNERSISRFNRLLGVDGVLSGDDFGRFGLGHQRTLADYEQQAGIRFSDRHVARRTLAQCHPNYLSEGDAEDFLASYTRHVPIALALLANDDLQFIGIFANDDQGREIGRRDVLEVEIWNVLTEYADAIEFSFSVKFFSRVMPATLTVWPYFKQTGWGERVVTPWI